MAMLSMTGFGQGAASDAEGSATAQLASVNNRALAIHLKSDLHDLALEEEARARIKEAAGRGSITAHLSWQPARQLALDLDRLETAWRDLAERARRLGAPAPTLEAVAHLLPSARAERPPAAAELLRRALAQAIQALRAMRATEGGALARDLRAHAASLRRLHGEMSRAAAGRTAGYRESLAARLREVLQGQASVTPEHLVRELALHAERIDVSEELVRLAAHLDALDALLSSSEEAVGRKLEFLLQECGREVNTTGAKANDAALSALTLEAKYVVEQMKEQAANVA
jgi:uncharacterized protein (TIGR00255 family)